MTDYPPKIAKALHEVMQKVGYVQKKGRNEFHRYNYAGEADLLEVLRPAMLEAGLLLIPSGDECSPIDEYGNTHVKVAYTLLHKDGEVWPEKIYAFGAGNDKNSKGGVQDKGTYKALTGANKYLLFKLFQIETGDDPERSEETAPPPAKQTIQGGVRPGDESGADKVKTDKLADIPRNEEEWKAWAVNAFKPAIDGCKTVAALDKIMSGMDDRLKALKHASPNYHKHLIGIANSKRSDLEKTELTPLDAG